MNQGEAGDGGKGISENRLNGHDASRWHEK
jgi:hypothetical protein